MGRIALLEFGKENATTWRVTEYLNNRYLSREDSYARIKITNLISKEEIEKYQQQLKVERDKVELYMNTILFDKDLRTKTNRMTMGPTIDVSYPKRGKNIWVFTLHKPYELVSYMFDKPVRSIYTYKLNNSSGQGFVASYDAGTDDNPTLDILVKNGDVMKKISCKINNNKAVDVLSTIIDNQGDAKTIKEFKMTPLNYVPCDVLLCSPEDPYPVDIKKALDPKNIYKGLKINTVNSDKEIEEVLKNSFETKNHSIVLTDSVNVSNDMLRKYRISNVFKMKNKRFYHR